MALPASWTLVTITGTFTKRNGSPAQGYVTFESMQPVVIGGVIIVPDVIRANLDGNGQISVQLPSTNDPDLSVTGWTYTVTEHMDNGRGPYQIEVPYTVASLDLASIPVATPNPSVPSSSVLHSTDIGVIVSGDVNLRSDLASSAAGKGAELVTFLQSGTSATPRNLEQRGQDWISVADFAGADPTGATASDTAFSSAIASLPAAGGNILVPDGTWKLDVTPSMGTKSIQWDISAGATFTGAVGGTNTQGVSWPRADTNYTLVPFGIFSQVRTSAPLTTQAPSSAIFEALQPSSYNGNSVAIYAGARGSSATGNVWAMNPLISADAGAGGTYHGIELDVNCFSASALVKGLGISGVGNQNPDVAIEIQHGMVWDRGIDILNCTIGIQLRTSVATGIAVNAPAGGTGSVLTGKQHTNGGETLWLERNTDTAPAGNFLRFRNAANAADLFTVDITGAATSAATITAANLTATSAVTGATVTSSGITTATGGLVAGTPSAGSGSVIRGEQLSNGSETLTLQRATDSSPTGNFLRFRNQADNADLFSVDITGGVTAAGIVTSAGFTTTGTVDTFNMALRFAAPTVGAGNIGVGNGTATTVGAAGGASALPATPTGYWIINVAGTNKKIPFYEN